MSYNRLPCISAFELARKFHIEEERIKPKDNLQQAVTDE